ncbi:MAG: hypothetical protein M0Z34_07070 [Nitrospiraceae bacterium]|nr:hypothetical protein [Nitrospiraceae bacterium]
MSPVFADAAEELHRVIDAALRRWSSVRSGADHAQEPVQRTGRQVVALRRRVFTKGGLVRLQDAPPAATGWLAPGMLCTTRSTALLLVVRSEVS